MKLLHAQSKFETSPKSPTQQKGPKGQRLSFIDWSLCNGYLYDISYGHSKTSSLLGPFWSSFPWICFEITWDDHQLPRCLNSMPTLDGVRSMEGRKMTAAQVATLRIGLAKRQGGEHSDIVDPYRILYYIGAFALVRHSVQTRQVWPQPWRDVSPHCLEVDFEEHGWSCKWQRNRRRNCPGQRKSLDEICTLEVKEVPVFPCRSINSTFHLGLIRLSENEFMPWKSPVINPWPGGQIQDTDGCGLHEGDAKNGQCSSCFWLKGPVGVEAGSCRTNMNEPKGRWRLNSLRRRG